jgi:hypothetical protein
LPKTNDIQKEVQLHMVTLQTCNTMIQGKERKCFVVMIAKDERNMYSKFQLVLHNWVKMNDEDVTSRFG